MRRVATPLPATKDKPSGYVCACGREHRFTAYVLAQTAQGHELSHVCDCGRDNTVGPRQVVVLGQLSKPARPVK